MSLRASSPLIPLCCFVFLVAGCASQQGGSGTVTQVIKTFLEGATPRIKTIEGNAKRVSITLDKRPEAGESSYTLRISKTERIASAKVSGNRLVFALPSNDKYHSSCLSLYDSGGNIVPTQARGSYGFGKRTSGFNNSLWHKYIEQSQKVKEARNEIAYQKKLLSREKEKLSSSNIWLKFSSISEGNSCKVPPKKWKEEPIFSCRNEQDATRVAISTCIASIRIPGFCGTLASSPIKASLTKSIARFLASGKCEEEVSRFIGYSIPKYIMEEIAIEFASHISDSLKEEGKYLSALLIDMITWGVILNKFNRCYNGASKLCRITYKNYKEEKELRKSYSGQEKLKNQCDMQLAQIDSSASEINSIKRKLLGLRRASNRERAELFKMRRQRMTRLASCRS